VAWHVCIPNIVDVKGLVDGGCLLHSFVHMTVEPYVQIG